MRTMLIVATLALQASICVSLSSAAQPADKASAAWAGVLEAQDAADKARIREDAADVEHKPSFHEERVKFFQMAVSKLLDFQTHYQTDQATVLYLRSLYRLAMYLEGAEAYHQAIDAYRKCQNHAKYHDPTALYDGKPVDQLVPARLKAISLLNPEANFAGSPFPAVRIGHGFQGTGVYWSPVPGGTGFQGTGVYYLGVHGKDRILNGNAIFEGPTILGADGSLVHLDVYPLFQPGRLVWELEIPDNLPDLSFRKSVNNGIRRFSK